MKFCDLYNRKCIECGDCEVCDLEEGKTCDNCGRCLNETEDFRTLNIEDFYEKEKEKEEIKKWKKKR